MAIYSKEIGSGCILSLVRKRPYGTMTDYQLQMVEKPQTEQFPTLQKMGRQEGVSLFKRIRSRADFRKCKEAYPQAHS
jgi:hypothetical protein